MQDNIYLVGLMGAGKTTVGRRLSKLLDLEFIDTDQLLEEKTGVTVSHIFEIEGEAGFRERETRLLEEIHIPGGKVVSTGGGLVLSEKNRDLMRKSGHVIYLKASITVLWRRLKDCQNRPLLQTENPKARLEQLLHERDPIYMEAAESVVRVDSDSAHRTAMKILRMLNTKS